MPGPTTVRVGGNTPCVSIDLLDGSLLAIDGGTGLRNLGHHLLAREAMAAGRGRATLLFSHRHWDHIQGLPFFEPAYIAGNRFDLYFPASDRGGNPLDDNVVSLCYAPANFPVPYDAVRQAYRFHPVREGERFQVGPATVEPVRLNHPGTALGYVITEPRSPAAGDGAAVSRVAYLCDTGPWKGLPLGDGMGAAGEPPAAVLSRYCRRLVAAVRGADLVIHDTFFDDAGYTTRTDWGHATPAHALALCRQAGVRRLHLYHYAPDLDDDAVSRLEAEARAMAGDIQVTAAVEGLELTLPAHRPLQDSPRGV
jgi:ribonuclease BN (tRNA processing enzyme)